MNPRLVLCCLVLAAPCSRPCSTGPIMLATDNKSSGLITAVNHAEAAAAAGMPLSMAGW